MKAVKKMAGAAGNVEIWRRKENKQHERRWQLKAWLYGGEEN